VAWDWNLGDGTTTNGQNVAHVYATAGTYAVTLLVTDTSGQVTGLARLVHVGG
jgi:PKD repeat protein